MTSYTPTEPLDHQWPVSPVIQRGLTISVSEKPARYQYHRERQPLTPTCDTGMLLDEQKPEVSVLLAGSRLNATEDIYINIVP